MSIAEGDPAAQDRMFDPDMLPLLRQMIDEYEFEPVTQPFSDTINPVYYDRPRTLCSVSDMYEYAHGFEDDNQAIMHVRRIFSGLWDGHFNVFSLERQIAKGIRLDENKYPVVRAWHAMGLTRKNYDPGVDPQYTEQFLGAALNGSMLAYFSRDSELCNFLLGYFQNRLGDKFDAEAVQEAAKAYMNPENLFTTNS
jgi:hypothetical protein